MDCALVLDIGGTFIKSALAEWGSGALVQGTEYEIPTCADDINGEIFNSLKKTVEHARAFGHVVEKASVCIPGPFDYTNGISLMQHKFSAISHTSLTPFFRSMGLSVVYLHDSTAFLLGELMYGAAHSYIAPLGIMLGTGFGFAMASYGQIYISEDQRPTIRMWNKPYGDGIVEDYVSRRAIRAIYQSISGSLDELDVKEIGSMAEQGDSVAQSVFWKVGWHIGMILTSYIPEYSYDCVVLGGQIARSYKFIIPGITESISRPVFPAAHISDAALRGAAGYLLRGKDVSVQVVSEAQVLGRSVSE